MQFFAICFISWAILLIHCHQLCADPIVKHRQGTNGRAEYVRAIINPSDLNKGESTSKNQTLAKKIKEMGKNGDDCGHIVASVLGGPMKAYNLFPQNLAINRGEFRTTVEAHMQNFLKLGKENNNGNYQVSFTANLVYTKDVDTRPTWLKFDIRFTKDRKLVPFTDIPISGKHRVPSNPYVGVILNP